MIMNGRCSLDLCLSPVTSTVSDQSKSRRSNTALYNGRLGEYDVVEIQIRAVIEMASKQREVTALELAPVRLISPLGFSVKRSLKSFLEKRKKKKRSSTSFITPPPHFYTYASSSSSSSHHF